MDKCDISINRVFYGEACVSVEAANFMANDSGYEYFSYDDTVYITRNPIWFSESTDKTKFTVSDLVTK